MLLVTSSGAGPPLAVLNLIPKSLSGPPGLCEAVSKIPPSVLRDRIKAETAGVERIESLPRITCLIPLAAAILRMICEASGDYTVSNGRGDGRDNPVPGGALGKGA